MESVVVFKFSGKFFLRLMLSCVGGFGFCFGVVFGFFMGCGGVRSEVFIFIVIYYGW